MKIKKMIAGHLLVLALVFPHAVSAEDFSFNLGINANSLHEDVTAIKLVCRVGILGTTNIIGSGFTIIPAPADGNLNTTKQVKFDVNSGQNPEDAGYYSCNIDLISQDSTSSVFSDANPLCNDANVSDDWRCIKPGTTKVNLFSGQIP